MPWTHFHVASDKTITLFDLGLCEHCTGKVREVNSVTGHDSPSYYRALGLTEWTDNLPCEITLSDDGDCICEACL